MRILKRLAFLVLMLVVVLEAGVVEGRHLAGRPTASRLVVVDPGHGGKDPGTTGVTGDQEKTIVLAVGRKVAARLSSAGLKTTMARSTDVFVDLDERSAIANRLGADVLVSIHANYNPDRRIHGFTVYISPQASRRSRVLAHAVESSMRAAGFASLGVRECPYSVLVNSRGPAMLIELGFVSNAAENARMCTVKGQDRYAKAISRGISEGLKRR